MGISDSKKIIYTNKSLHRTKYLNIYYRYIYLYLLYHPIYFSYINYCERDCKRKKYNFYTKYAMALPLKHLEYCHYNRNHIFCIKCAITTSLDNLKNSSRYRLFDYEKYVSEEMLNNKDSYIFYEFPSVNPLYLYKHFSERYKFTLYDTLKFSVCIKHILKWISTYRNKKKIILETLDGVLFKSLLKIVYNY